MPDWSELLRDHRPLLVYDSRETYFADAASSLVGNAFGAGPGRPTGRGCCAANRSCGTWQAAPASRSMR